MKIEAGKKYRVKDIEKSILSKVGTSLENGNIVETYFLGKNGYWVLGGEWMGIEIEFFCLEDAIYNIAENLWQTLCYVKQALDSGAPIDKEYIAKVLADNRPEENSNPQP